MTLSSCLLSSVTRSVRWTMIPECCLTGKERFNSYDSDSINEGIALLEDEDELIEGMTFVGVGFGFGLGGDVGPGVIP